MKTTAPCSFLLLTILIIHSPTFAQDTTDAPSKRSFFMLYNGSRFESVGLKYRLSNTFSIFAELSFRYTSERATVTQDRESDRTVYGVDFGLQSVIIRSSKASVYIVCSVGYYSDKSSSSVPFAYDLISSQDYRLHHFDVDIGPGVEFQIAEWFSLSGQQVLRIFTERSTYKSSLATTADHKRASGVIWGVPTIVASFFF